MGFAIDEGMIHQYWSQGYIAMRGILPGSLVRDLRVEAAKARELGYKKFGPQAQRSPLIKDIASELNMKPFEDYFQLPELVRALERMFGPGSGPGSLGYLSILIEPQRYPRHGGWHRDGAAGVSIEKQRDPEWLKQRAERIHRPRAGNQVNCALYQDSSLWYVPGSHLRVRDLEGERQTHCFTTGKNPFELPDMNPAELEWLCIEDCRKFPGAVQMHLSPGDYLLYRSEAWHCGIGIPTSPRATLHDIPTYDWKQGLNLASA